VELAFSPSPGLKGKIFFYKEINRTPDGSKNSKYGAAGAPDWDYVHLQPFPAKTIFA
jgi:hypothetical protein